MEENIIAQFESLKKEEKEVRKDIEALKNRLKCLQNHNQKTVVKGGYGGTQRYTIDELAKDDVEETEYLLKKRIRQLRTLEKEVAEMIVDIQEFINGIDNSMLRRIITKKYIHGKTWYQVAQEMGERYSPDSCKKLAHRYLKNFK